MAFNQLYVTIKMGTSVLKVWMYNALVSYVKEHWLAMLDIRQMLKAL